MAVTCNNGVQPIRSGTVNSAVRTRVLIAQPGYGTIEPEAYQSAQRATNRTESVSATVVRMRSSLLAHGFNDAVCMALNNGHDYFAMLHGDIAADHDWLDILLDDMIELEADVIHAPSPIKDSQGLTSTAVAYSDDPFSVTRRITLHELSELPDKFTAETLRQVYDPDARHLLPNTGCMLMNRRTMEAFPGFEISSYIRHADTTKWQSVVCPEDWNLGWWCGRNGHVVAATKRVKIRHFGRTSFPTDLIWGAETDEFWQKHKGDCNAIRE